MTQRQFRELQVQIARYRFLEQEVTDPLAASLLHGIVLELEAQLPKRLAAGPALPPGGGMGGGDF